MTCIHSYTQKLWLLESPDLIDHETENALGTFSLGGGGIVCPSSNRVNWLIICWTFSIPTHFEGLNAVLWTELIEFYDKLDWALYSFWPIRENELTKHDSEKWFATTPDDEWISMNWMKFNPSPYVFNLNSLRARNLSRWTIKSRLVDASRVNIEVLSFDFVTDALKNKHWTFLSCCVNLHLQKRID